MAKEQSVGVPSRRAREAPLSEQKEDFGAALLYSTTDPLSSDPPSDEVNAARKRNNSRAFKTWNCSSQAQNLAFAV
jgi:hypothetical protein